MSRLLLLIAIVIVVYWVFRSYRKGNTPERNNVAAEDMVRCAQCGVHLPKGECIKADGLTFCCEEHRDAHHP
ncbi:MAG: PP0621 family protein [Gallionella sp.]|jgi:uncharacterized protein